jgi:hypothetical protein
MVAWHTTDPRNLDTRWDEAVAQLAKVGGAAFWPKNESNLFLMLQEVQRRTPTPPPPDATMRALYEEYSLLLHRYARAEQAIRQLQFRLRPMIDSETHRLLADVPRDWNREFPRVDPMRSPDFPALGDGRRMINELLQATLKIEEFRDRLDAALAIEKTVPEILHHKLIFKLFARVEALEQQISTASKGVNHAKRQR